MQGRRTLRATVMEDFLKAEYDLADLLIKAFGLDGSIQLTERTEDGVDVQVVQPIEELQNDGLG